MNAPQFFHENVEASQAALAASQSSSFFKFEENTVSCLYLLPPWSQRGFLARMIRECFLGKNRGRHTCWASYEIFGHPELGRRDPVTQVVFDAYAARGKPDNIKKMLPNTRWYANAIIAGTMKLDAQTGAELPDYYPLMEPKQQIVGFTDALWRDLDKVRRAPGIGCIYDPTAATCVIVKRDDTKEITKYTVALAGARGAGTFTPEKTNLFEYFEKLAPGKGAQMVTDILSSLNDLDAKWPMPNEAAFAEAAVQARALQAELMGSGGQSNGAAIGPPGGFTPPGSFAPPAPGAFSPPVAPVQTLPGGPILGAAPVVPVAPTAPGAPGLAGPPLRAPGVPVGGIPFAPPGFPGR